MGVSLIGTVMLCNGTVSGEYKTRKSGGFEYTCCSVIVTVGVRGAPVNTACEGAINCRMFETAGGLIIGNAEV